MEQYGKLAEGLFRELCVIPAPSHHEQARAAYCLEKLQQFGYSDAYIDEALNVILEFPCPRTEETVIIQAHTDVVFPDTTPLPLTEDAQNYYNPGCGDDTVCVAMLLSAAKALRDRGMQPDKRVVLVLNSCEEGLGNLKGTKAVMEKYGSQVTQFITFDGKYSAVVDCSVGSHRYRVTVKTPGGHSYGNFGNENAARVLAEGIRMIYSITLPSYPGKTTYNVGMISGGTSVNTIIQEASMLCEYRSDHYESLAYMKEQFAAVFAAMGQLAEVTVELVGQRPCMEGVDPAAQQRLTDWCVAIQKKHTGLDVKVCSGSTDANVPQSMGIPAVCAGCYMGGGAHTREEWLEKASIAPGFAIVWDIVSHYFNGRD